MITRSFRPDFPVDLRHTLGVLRRGRADPAMIVSAREVWRATRTPEGPATTRITARPGLRGPNAVTGLRGPNAVTGLRGPNAVTGLRGPNAVAELTMQAWGPGAQWAVERFPALVGATGDEGPFPPAGAHGVVADLRRRMPGLRICRTGAVTEALVPTILEQKVIGIEARRSYARLVSALGEDAPGPSAGPRLRVPPAPEVLARTATYVFHRFGIERKRADAVRIACSYASRLDEAATLPLAQAYARLTALPGIGAWTAAEVALVALGDPDAVSVGDYHLPHQVAYALAGERQGDDARMLELLEPYRGHRGTVIRLIVSAGIGPPRRGPRLPLNPIAGL